MEPRPQGIGSFFEKRYSPQMFRAMESFAHDIASNPTLDAAFGLVGPLKIIEQRVAKIKTEILKCGGTFDQNGRLVYDRGNDPFGAAAVIDEIQLASEKEAYGNVRGQIEEYLKRDPEAEDGYREVEVRFDAILRLDPNAPLLRTMLAVNTLAGMYRQR